MSLIGRFYTIKQVNDYIYMLFNNEPFLEDIAVRGEVSNLTYHRSGHIYFDMKDSSGKLSAVMFRSSRGGLSYPMQEGDEIIAKGTVSVYRRGGSYSLQARAIERAGRGDLFEQYERLKKELSEMGMFDESYKQPIPPYASSLGIVTAPTGAAVRDIISIAKRRNPYIEIILAPVLVQGDEAPSSIISGLERLDALGLDVIICGRGGGSMEDLWAFNDEGLARAIFNMNTPVISAVGHETDFTIADFVADIRAATPSEAAELAVFDYSELIMRMGRYRTSLESGMQSRINDLIRRLDLSEERLKRLHPKGSIEKKRAALKERAEAIDRLMRDRIKSSRQRLMYTAGKLEGQSPAKRLAAGYSFLTNSDGEAIKSAGDVKPEDLIKNYVSDGVIYSVVKQGKK